MAHGGRHHGIYLLVAPFCYLGEATPRAIANPGTVTLPHDLLGA